MQVLAGDIGGTSTRLAYFDAACEKLTLLAEGRFPSRKAGSLEEIVRRFIGEQGLTAERACFGIAGPVRHGTVRTPNLPWSVNAEDLSRALGIPEVRLINDLEAHVYGIDLLGPEDFEILNKGVPNPTGTIALVSAGTGLGEAVAYWDGSVHRPYPSEGGHADFAPRTEIEAELLLYLRDKHGRVSTERVLSGPGLRNIYRFLRDGRHLSESPAVAEEMLANDPSAVITRAALSSDCLLCEQALDLFVSLYGAEAGNVALRYLATGGVYLGGGIAPKIIDRLRGPGFLLAFTAKGRLSPLLETIPVRVILNDRSALLGAGRCAAC
ncbi:glucokinase [Syntrophus gentianae]|uniref:Glucokinase n=1 Tax=Syntrophus gentianae TaxID=43775 RepID=A0A1H8B156_9BACT|nr:glucokinase [Syntrophus gentianae]SEM76523.1 glucokinase [Syntrophus gentianae]